jgi:hypothetical protein
MNFLVMIYFHFYFAKRFNLDKKCLEINSDSSLYIIYHIIIKNLINIKSQKNYLLFQNYLKYFRCCDFNSFL